MAAATNMDIPIIDAHVHLYPESEITTLAWCSPEHPLARQQSVQEYKTASANSPLKGFIFLETSRKNDLDAGVKDGSGWEGPLAEVSWLRRIVTGQPRAGEGHSKEDASLCAAYIPWAPLPSGPAAMERYIELVKKEAGESWPKVRGFRYLVQEQPKGTMLQDGFIESLKLLGRKGLVFELGVDQHRRGRGQLEEALEMIDRAHEDVPEEERVVFIINHMCKPDLEVCNTFTSPSFIAWRVSMFALSKASRTYMKLSGGFSEMTESLKQRAPEDIFEALVPWLTVIITAFGPDRIMFASDWPICTIGIGDGAWGKWRKIVERLCWMASFDEDQQKKIWGGTALKAYGIES